MRQRIKRTSISYLAITASLAALPMAAQAANVAPDGAGVTYTFDSSISPTTCRVSGALFFVSGQVRDSIVNFREVDFYQPAVRDGGSTIVGTGSQESVGRQQSSFRRLTADIDAMNSFSGPLEFGILDTGSASNGAFKPAQNVPLNQMAQAGGACTTIAASILPNTAPTAEAGANQTIDIPTSGTPLATVNLDASSSTDPDPFDSTLTYQWSQTSGPTLSLAAGSSATDISPTYVQPAAPATTVFELTVTDSQGATSTDTVSVVWREQNIAPVADAGGNLVVNDVITNQTSIRVDASGSSDANGDALTYTWRVSGRDAGGVNPFNGTNISSPIINFTFNFAYQNNGTPLTQGQFNLELIVNDGQTDSVADTISVVVNEQNLAPVISFVGSNSQTVNVAEVTPRFNLSARNSSDPERQPLTYRWTQITGLKSNFATTSNQSTFQPDFAGFERAEPTNFTFQLDLSDGTNTVTDTYAINVTPQEVTPSLRIFDSPSSFVTSAGFSSTCRITVDARQIGGVADSGNLDQYSFQALSETGALIGRGTTASATVGEETNFNASVDIGGGTSQRFDNIIFEVRDIVSGGSGPVVYRKIIPVTDLASRGACTTLKNNAPGASGNTIPIANAGADQLLTVAPGTLISLTGQGSSDPDGDSLSYLWEQVGGTPVTLNDATRANPSFTYAPPPGQTETLVFNLTVNDGTIVSQLDQVSIQLTRANAAPTAIAGPDQQLRSVDNSTVVTLDGTNSSDPDANTTLTYQWTQVSGPAVTLTGATTAQPSFTGFTPSGTSTVVFELVVSDGAQTSAPDRVELLLSDSASLPPTPVVVAPTAPVTQTGAPGQTFTLSASGSTDPDNNTLTYGWAQTGGPDSLSPTNGTSLTDADVVFPVPTTPGTYTFLVTVDDGISPPVQQSVTVVISPPNSIPVADAGPNQAITVAASTVITLDGSASADADNDALTYRWTQTAGTTVTLSDPAAISPTFSYLPSAVETLTFQLIVNDGQVDSVASLVDVEITPGVTSGAIDPVSYRDGVNGCAISAPFTFQGFTDDGSNEDNFRVVLTSSKRLDSVGTEFNSSAMVGQSISGLANQAFDVAAGTTSPPLFLSLIDVDAGGAARRLLSQSPIDLDALAATGSNCRIEVKNVRGNSIPVAVSAADQIINDVDANTTVTLDASASTDADSDTLTYRWVQTSGPTVTLTDPTTATPSFMFVPAMMDTITFDVFVSDGTDESQADSVEIKLNRANALPVANAGPNQALRTARPGATQTPQPLTLDGSPSIDADGDALTYRWAQVAGPTLSLASGSSLTDAQPIFDAPNQEGTFTFELIVNDGFGDSPADQVDVVYTFFDNEAPIANAGVNQTVDQAVGNVSVTLDATAEDAENGPLTFAWTQVSGPTVTLSDPTAAAPSFSFDMTGQTTDVVFVFSVVSNDGQASSAADEVTITLTPNAIPIADAGVDQTIARLDADTVVTLDGSASADGDGDTLTYAWTQVSGPSVTLSDATSAAPTFSFDPGADTSAQTFVFDLVVSDGRVTSSADRVEISASPNNTPTADAGQTQIQTAYVAGAPVQLDGRNSDDPNGDQLQYQWVQLSGPTVTLDDPTSATPSFTYNPNATGNVSTVNVLKSAAGTAVSAMPNLAVDFVFGLRVSDGTLQSPQSEVRISLTVNDPPESDAGEDQALETPADGAVITLDGSGSSDPEGDALTYSWVQTSGRTVTLSDATAVNPTFTYDYPNPLPAEETFTFALTINDGNQDSEIDEVTITVINNQAPTANAGSDIGPINSGAIVTLNGGASTDPDDDVLTYAWTQVSGPTVTLSDTTAQSPTFTAPDVEDLSTLVFELVVNDGRVDSLADQVSVSVQPIGSVRIVQRVTGSDGTFTYTSDLAALNTSLTTSGGTGQLVADRVGTGVYTITARDERDNGYALTDLICSDDDSATNLSNRTATVRLAPGEDVTCTFDLVNSREAASKAIRTALLARSQLILASEPDIQRRIDRLNKRTASGSGASIAGLTLPGSNKVGLSATLSEGSKNISGSLLAANADGVLKGQLDGATKGGKIDVWGEAQIQDFNFQGEDGDFSILYMGADYLVSDNLLIGGLVSVDDFRFGNVEQAGYVNGDGFMAGPYATAKIGERLYIDARAAWGTSDNNVNPLGTFTDAFDTNRALYATTVSGDWTFKNQLNVRPELSIKHLSESQQSYTDSLGVLIPKQTVGLGELAFGPRLSKPVVLGRRWTMTPYGEAKGVFNFGDDAKDILQNDTRLRLEGGADWSSVDGVRIGFNGFTDGIGSDDLESYGLRVSLAYTMK